MSTASQVPITDTYEDVKHLLYYFCHRFQKKFGGQFEELLSEANVAFMAAYETFNPAKGEFSTLLGSCVQNRLLDMLGRERKWQMVSLDQPNEDGARMATLIEDKGIEFDFEEYAEGLSSDARYVLQLALRPPQKVERAVESKGGQPRNWRSSIREHLRELGWSYPGIDAVFHEIKTLTK